MKHRWQQATKQSTEEGTAEGTEVRLMVTDSGSIQLSRGRTRGSLDHLFSLLPILMPLLLLSFGLLSPSLVAAKPQPPDVVLVVGQGKGAPPVGDLVDQIILPLLSGKVRFIPFADYAKAATSMGVSKRRLQSASTARKVGPKVGADYVLLITSTARKKKVRGRRKLMTSIRIALVDSESGKALLSTKVPLIAGKITSAQGKSLVAQLIPKLVAKQKANTAPVREISLGQTYDSAQASPSTGPTSSDGSSFAAKQNRRVQKQGVNTGTTQALPSSATPSAYGSAGTDEPIPFQDLDNINNNSDNDDNTTHRVKTQTSKSVRPAAGFGAMSRRGKNKRVRAEGSSPAEGSNTIGSNESIDANEVGGFGFGAAGGSRSSHTTIDHVVVEPRIPPLRYKAMVGGGISSQSRKATLTPASDRSNADTGSETPPCYCGNSGGESPFFPLIHGQFELYPGLLWGQDQEVSGTGSGPKKPSGLAASFSIHGALRMSRVATVKHDTFGNDSEGALVYGGRLGAGLQFFVWREFALELKLTGGVSSSTFNVSGDLFPSMIYQTSGYFGGELSMPIHSERYHVFMGGDYTQSLLATSGDDLAGTFATGNSFRAVLGARYLLTPLPLMIALSGRYEHYNSSFNGRTGRIAGSRYSDISIYDRALSGLATVLLLF